MEKQLKKGRKPNIMKKVGIFYGSNSGNTEAVAKKIQQEIGEDQADIFDIARTTPEKLTEYDNLIFGLSTWGEGDYQDDWVGFALACKEIDLQNKVIALFGLGDQENYPDSFANALGKLYKKLIEKDCHIIGKWPGKDYSFKSTQAYDGEKFVGLILDEDVQPEKTDERIKQWVKQITRHFY